MRRKDEVQTENDIEFREIQADSMSKTLESSTAQNLLRAI